MFDFVKEVLKCYVMKYVFISRGVMVGSVIGLAITLGTLGLMATNNLSKKKR
jgi:hypothetical protein